MIKVYHHHGEIEELIGAPLTLERAQKIVAGYVEIVRVAQGVQMIVNEDGLSMNLPRNLNASALAGVQIVGDAVLLTGRDCWK